jgi:hypothetical protein
LAPSYPASPVKMTVVSLSLSTCASPVELTDGRGGGSGGGAKSYDGEKAWSSITINNSLQYILHVPDRSVQKTEPEFLNS